MSYYSYQGCDQMAIDYYNANTGVTSRLATGVLLMFMINGTLTSGRLKQANDNLNTSSSSISTTMCSSFYHRSWDQGDPGDWIYAKSELIRSSSLVRGTYLYETYFKNGHVGDKIIWYNKNNPSFKMSLEFRGSVTDNAHVYRIGRMRLEVPGLASYYTGDITISGVDSFNRAREFCIGFVADYQNGYACPYYVTYTFDYDSDTGNYGTNGSCELTNLYGYINSNKNQYNNIYRYFLYQIFAGQLPEPTEDPYPPNDISEPEGGDGDFDDTSDIIDMPTTPTLTVSSSRFVTIYTPDAQQIEDLAGRLIDPTIFQALANAVEDISSCVIGLHIVPIVVPYTVPDRQVCCNFMGVSIGLGVYLNKATAQFLDVDCGSLDVEEYWGNCLDYAPYTQISLFLPFCGFYDLDVDEVMGKTIQVKYRVDIASGSCMASIIVNGSVMYQYSGNCSQQIPVSSVDFNSFLANAFNVAVATATSGAAVAAAGSAVLGAGDSTSPLSTNQMDSASAQKMAMAHYDTVKMRAEGRIAGAAVNAVMNSKPHYNHGGSLSGSTGFLGCKKPYLIIKRPNPMIPSMYGKFHGYPCNTTANLNDLAGYTEVADIRLNIPDATVDEIIECERLLKDGVVL